MTDTLIDIIEALKVAENGGDTSEIVDMLYNIVGLKNPGEDRGTFEGVLDVIVVKKSLRLKLNGKALQTFLEEAFLDPYQYGEVFEVGRKFSISIRALDEDYE